MIEFEWDSAKAKSNARKHGVTFEEAALVFQDPSVCTEPDRIVDGELRWQSIGIVHGVLVVLVAHIWEIEQHGETEVIRIISARRADPKERARYDEARTKDAGGY